MVEYGMGLVLWVHLPSVPLALHVRVLVHAPSALFPNLLFVDAPGKAVEDVPSAWVPVSTRKSSKQFLALALVLWGMNQQMEDLWVSLCLFPCCSAFQINACTHIFKKKHPDMSQTMSFQPSRSKPCQTS